MKGMLNWKTCEECGKPFDIAIDNGKCPNCRGFEDPEEIKMEDVFG